MTDEEYESQKARVKQLLDKWTQPLGLLWWNMKVNYIRESSPRDGTTFCPIMAIETDWRYLLATLFIYVPEIVGMDDEELEHCLLHEFAHIFVSELRDQTPEDHRNHEERVVTWMARSWQWVWEAAQDTKEDETVED